MWCDSSLLSTTEIIKKTLKLRNPWEAAEILTGLGFLVGMEGCKTIIASSQGAWLLLLLPFLVKSCPLMVRVWPLFRLILPLQLTSQSLSLRTTPSHSMSPVGSVFSSCFDRSSRKSPYSILQSQYEFRPGALRRWDQSDCSCSDIQRNALKKGRTGERCCRVIERWREFMGKTKFKLFLLSLASFILYPLLSSSVLVFLCESLPYAHYWLQALLHPPLFNPFNV